MQCCVCKAKEAKVHLTQIVGDKMQKVDLCEECAAQKGVNDPAGFSLADLLLGLGASQEMEQAGGGELKCPNCGFTQADFKKAGRLGCSECYQTFAEGLEGLLKAVAEEDFEQAAAMRDEIKVTREKISALGS
jgi:protein arginine kinase activator